MTMKESVTNMIRDLDEHNDFYEGYYSIEIDKFYLNRITELLKEQGYFFEVNWYSSIDVYLPDEDENLEIVLIEGNKTREYKEECNWLDCWERSTLKW